MEDNKRGWKWTPEARARRREMLRNRTPEQKAETARRISESKKGVPRDVETREKISRTKSGVSRSRKTRERISRGLLRYHDARRAGIE